jgi:hypothetical protein
VDEWMSSGIKIFTQFKIVSELLEDSNEDDYTLVDNFVLESVFLQIDPGPQHFLGKEILTHEIPVRTVITKKLKEGIGG